MSFKTILAILDLEGGDAARISPALPLARSLGAHLDVLLLGEAPHLPFYGYGSQGYLQIVVEEGEKRAERLKAAGDALRSLLEKEGIAFEVHPCLAHLEGEDYLVARHSILADLTVLLRSAPGRLSHVERRAIDGALFDAGRPVLVSPNGASFQSKPRRIVIAWNGRREAARAAASALPFLKQVGDATLLLVDPEDEPDGRGGTPGAGIAQLLARHGVKVGVRSVSGDDRPLARTLLENAHALGADLVVMGAYGHSRLRETILGGTTHQMLEESDISLFLSH